MDFRVRPSAVFQLVSPFACFPMTSMAAKEGLLHNTSSCKTHSESTFTSFLRALIVASLDRHKVFVLLSAEVAPENPSFRPSDLDGLYNAAREAGAIPYYASVSMASANNAHFNAGIIMYGDEMRFSVNAVGELEKE